MHESDTMAGDTSEEKLLVSGSLLSWMREDPAVSLLDRGQRLGFVSLSIARVVVGCCDLLLAGSMYLLFLLLQGRMPPRHWGVPGSTLSAALLIATMLALRAALDLASTRFIVAYTQGLYVQLLLRLTQAYNDLRWVQFAQRNRSELLNHLTLTLREVSNFYHLAIEIAASSVVVMLMIGALIHQSLPTACIMGVMIAAFYGVHRLFIRTRVQQAAVRRDDAVHALHRTLADMLASARQIRSYGIGAFMQNRIRGQARSVAAGYREVAFIPQVSRVMADQGVVLVFLCFVIAVQIRHGDSSRLVSLLVFYFVLCRRLLPLISQLSMMTGQIESSYKSVQSVCRELKECSMNRASAATNQRPRPDNILELEQVTFSFPHAARTLDGVSLIMRKGEVVVLRGVSGVGKSSLLNLIAGLMQPDSGVIRVLQESAAYVPQEVVLLDDSIRNNLLFGLPGATDRELMRALTIANLQEFVMDHPFGLDRAVGDNGVLLSGGQRQRVGLARAILRSPTLLLLDEATSALDEVSEARVLDNLRAAGVAVLLVTHRPCIRLGYCRVLRLEQGRLMEELNGVERDVEMAMLIPAPTREGSMRRPTDAL